MPRSTHNFKEHTKIDLAEFTQSEFENSNELARIILRKCKENYILSEYKTRPGVFLVINNPITQQPLFLFHEENKKPPPPSSWLSENWSLSMSEFSEGRGTVKEVLSSLAVISDDSVAVVSPSPIMRQ